MVRYQLCILEDNDDLL